MCHICERWRDDPYYFEQEFSWEDHVEARAEGWDITFEGHGNTWRDSAIVDGRPYGHRPFELRAEADDAIFVGNACDLDAQAFVVAKARAGSALHRRALAFLQRYSRFEYEAILREHPLYLPIPDDNVPL